MKRWLSGSWVFAMVLAVSGCGSYEPTVPAPPAGNAAAKKAYQESSEALVTALGGFEARLDRVKTAKFAEKTLLAVPQFLEEIKAAATQAKTAGQALSPEDRREVDLMFSSQVQAAMTALGGQAARLAKTPGPTAALGQVVAAGCKELEPLTRAPEPTRSPAATTPSAFAGPLLSGLLVLILVACVGFLNNEGIWSNVIRLIDVVLASLLALNFFEPTARWLTEKMPTFTTMWDFLALWGLFVVFLAISREITDRLSRVKVRFLKIIDRVGGGLLSAWIGWILVCFTLTTLHTAPLCKTFLFGAFQPGQKMFMGLAAPDLQWLAFTKKVSEGAYGCENPFDPQCTFVYKQSERRSKIESYMSQTHALRVNPEMAAPARASK